MNRKRLEIQQSKRLHKAGYVVLAVLALTFCWLFCIRWGVFGAKVDWISQHSVIPDYFRKQFYATGKLFPEFAMNLGGGQNIYNYSYYGLYSPLFLLSYALPFVKMSTYVMVMEVLCVVISTLLLYSWLCKKGFRTSISFMTSLVFLLSGPVIVQSYSQIMFVNYMPFLILAFMGVDRYFEKNRSGMLTISIFLMIMTSFYFSIGGMLALVIYGIHCYGRKMEEQKKRVTIKGFLCEGIRFLIPMLTAVLLSGVLLVPTAFALIGRSSGETSGSSATSESLSSLLGSGNIPEILKGLFLPVVRLGGMFYSPYGLGMGTLILSGLIATMFARKWSDRILAWLIAVVVSMPVFVYILNGGLYLRDKALIPLLPLLCYMLAMYLERFNRENFSWAGCIPFVVTMQLIYMGKNQDGVEKLWTLLMIESQIMLGCYLAAGMLQEMCRNRKKSHFTYFQNRRTGWGPVVILAGAMCVFLAVFDNQYGAEKQHMLDQTFYGQVTDEKIGDAIQKATDEAKKDGGFYRTTQLGSDDENAANLNRVWNIDQYISSIYSSSYNKAYQNFRKDTFGLEQPYRNFLMQPEEPNLIFQRFMGEKYVVSQQKLTGYHLIDKAGEWNIYENEQAAPVIYGTSQCISEKDYRKLQYPYNQTKLLEKAVVPETEQTLEAQKDENGDNLCGVTLDFGENKVLTASDGGYLVSAKKDTKVNVKIRNDGNSENQEQNQKVLLLRFKVKNQKPAKDLTIWVNGERNKLSAKQRVYYNDNTTFTYAVALDAQEDSVEVTFGKGKYNLSEMEAYLVNLPGSDLYESEFRKDDKASKGNVITGSLKMEKSGYLITSIPYDSGFDIQIDGKSVKSEKVNTAFLGCKVDAGQHKIAIIYHAPGLQAGKMLSLIGIIALAASCLLEKKRKIRNCV